jgi:tight adherence protein B
MNLSGGLLGLGLGVGLLLVWRSGSRAPARRSGPRRTGRRQQLLAAAGLTGINAAQLLALQVALGLAATVLVLLTTRTVTISLVFGAFGAAVPYLLVRRLAAKRRADLREVWPEAVDNLASAVRAGLALPEALGQLSLRGPEPLRPAFDAFALDYQVTGRFGECLDRLKVRLADPVGDRVVEGLRVAREVGGGDLGRLLRNLSGYLRDESRTRSELEARQAWTVNGARLAVTAPWLVLLMMSFQPTVIRRYASPAGTIVLLLAAGTCVVAYRLMMRIGRLPRERRILS